MNQQTFDFKVPTYDDELPNGITPYKLEDWRLIKQFVFAGNATFTLKSLDTLKRFTFRVRKTTSDKWIDRGGIERTSNVAFFVGLLTGPDNEQNFQYVGHVYKGDNTYTHGRRSKIGYDSPGAKAIHWFWRQMLSQRSMPDCEFWHEGRCGRCHRKLTVPESINRGIGPECAEIMGVVT